MAAPPPLSAPVGAALRLTPLQLTAMVIVVCTGFSSQMVVPMWIGAVIDDLALSAKAAGSIAAVEFACVAIVSLIVAAIVHRVSVRRLSIAGLIVLTLANGLSALATTLDALILWRAFAGIGKGLVVAGIFALAARTERPTRTFAVLNVTYAGFSTLFFLIVPHAINAGGMAGAFLTMAAVGVVGAVFLPLIPSSHADMRGAMAKGGKLTMAGGAVLLCLGLLWCAHNALWTFIERIGIELGLAVATIGAVLSLSSFITIGGPALARLVDTRFGLAPPILIAVGGKVVLALLIGFAVAAPIYLGATPLFQLLALFVVPYMQGLMAKVDPAGRLAAASSAAMTAGSALGAFIGGVTVDALGYPGLGVLSAILLFVVMLVVGGILRREQTGDTDHTDLAAETVAPVNERA